jgi:hypothetical protein
MSAIFDFSSLLTVLLLLICTCAYLRELRPMIFDSGLDAGQTAGVCVVNAYRLPCSSNEVSGSLVTSFLFFVHAGQARWSHGILLEIKSNWRTPFALHWYGLCANGNAYPFLQID